MRDSARAARHPTVLIASDQEASSRALESILVPNGYTVLKAYTAAQALERARSGQPEVIILDALLPDRQVRDVCRELSHDPHLTRDTPILIVSSEHATRQQRVDALRAGAWEHLGMPLDAEHLLLQLETFARVKLEADRARTEGLLDPATGLYNLRGVARRAQEFASQAARMRAPLACVVFAPDFDGAGEPSEETMQAAMHQMAFAFRTAGRSSDAIGRVGPTEFAVLAFATDGAGSVTLAERLLGALDAARSASGSAAPRFRLRAGYYAVSDARRAAVDPVQTVLRAAAALRLSRTKSRIGWIQPFPDGAPPGSPAA